MYIAVCKFYYIFAFSYFIHDMPIVFNLQFGMLFKFAYLCTPINVEAVPGNCH